MTQQELRSTLDTFSKFVSSHNTPKENLFSWYWSILAKYLENRDSVKFEELRIFDEFYPEFTKQLRRYGSTRADEIRKHYNQLRLPHYTKLRSIEDANPTVLYLQSPNKVYVRTNSQFIPFGKFEPPCDKEFFLEAILSINCETVPDKEQMYSYFKKYIYTHFVSTHIKHFPPNYAFILEEDLEKLRQKYPEFTQRFEDESLEFLDSLGYYDAFERFVFLKKEESDKLATLPATVADEMVSFLISKRCITVEYEHK